MININYNKWNSAAPINSICQTYTNKVEGRWNMSWKERGRISHFQQAWVWKRNQPSNREPLFLGFAPRELMKPLPCVRTEHDNAMKGHSCSRGSLSLSSKAGVILSKRTRCTVRNPLNACPQQLDRNRLLRDLYLLCPTEACTHLCPLQKKNLHNVGASLLSMPSFLFSFLPLLCLEYHQQCPAQQVLPCPFLTINSSWQRMEGDFQRKGYLSWNWKAGRSGA